MKPRRLETRRRRILPRGDRLLAVLLPAFLAACGPSAPAPRDPHPAFRLTAAELAAAAEGLPAEARALILARPAEYLEQVRQVLQGPPELLQLVDKGHALAAEQAPPDLEPLEEGGALKAGRAGLTFRRIVLPDLLAMAEGAREEGISLVVSSAYRSYGYQAQVFERNVREMGREAAERESARPGHSQHQLGTALDFGSIDDSFAETAAGRWLARKAWAFGFSLSYPRDGEQETGYRYEPWHFRWVGRPAARLIQEFYLGRQQLFLEHWRREGLTVRGKAPPVGAPPRGAAAARAGR